MKNSQIPFPTELAILSTVLGILIAEKLDLNQQNITGNFLEALGQTILLINAQIQSLQSQQQSQSSQSNNDASIKELQKQIDELKEYIKKRG